ncbi:hypothetical protein Q5X48_14895 [Acinetobacter baumannii]|nr:hypothetical protein [Acinetobacter baumannii]
MNPLIVTNCTSKKWSKLEKIFPDQHLFELDDPEQFIELWFKQVNQVVNKSHAIEVYKGRTVTEVIHAKEIINAKIFFLSAGLGLIAEDELIPNYDLTISSGLNSLKPLLDKWSIHEGIWGEKLLKHSNLEDIFQYSQSEIFVALPHNYLKMFLPIIENLSAYHTDKLRLFLHPTSYKILPEKLKKYYIPYTYKIESTSFSGTKVDYCQRCLHHFIKFIYKPNQDLKASITAVEKFLSVIPEPPEKIKRPSVSDAEINTFILEGWELCEGRSLKLLRYIRDVKQIACEQSRFRNLWRNIKLHKDIE